MPDVAFPAGHQHQAVRLSQKSSETTAQLFRALDIQPPAHTFFKVMNNIRVCVSAAVGDRKGDLRQGEGAGALLVDGRMHGAFQRGQHGADVLGGHGGRFGDVGDEARLAQRFLDRLRRGRLGGGLRCSFLGGLLRRGLLGALCHVSCLYGRVVG